MPLKTGSSTLTIPENVALNIPEGVTLELDSYYKDTLVDHITNNGTVRIACNHSSYTEYAAAFGGKVEKLHTWENGKCKYCNEPHTHTASDWTYTKGAEQNIIKATCKVCHKEATITLKAPENLTYDGTAKTVTVEQSPEGVLPNLPAVVYDGDHTNAGDHTATLTCGGVTATQKFTIGKANQTLSFEESSLTKNYGDSAFTPKLNHVGDGKVTYASSDEAVAAVDSTGKVTIKKAGTTNLTISAAESDNYNASTETGCTLTVNRKALTVSLADRNVTVGSTAPTVALTYGGLVSGDTVDFTPVFTLTDKDGKPLKGENDTELTFAEALTKAVSTTGSYTITWTNADALKDLNDEPGNYTFTVVEGGDTATLTVNSQPSSGGGGYSGGGGGTALPDTKPEPKPDTNKDETITKTETDTNSKGKEVVTTTTTKTDADGNVISVTEKTVIPESSASTSTTVTVRKDGKGEVTSARATITKTVTTGSKATIQSSILAQIIEAAGTSDVTVTMTVKDADGKTKYSVKADAKDFESGNKLYIYKYDTGTKEYIMVDGKTYTVSKAGNVSVSQKIKATYYLLDAEEAAEINKKILSTIKPKKASVTLKAGESVNFTLSGKANPDNIKSITYTTSKKSVATVSKKGKVYAKKKGTAIIKAKVTLKNGMTKTIKMKVKVK
ncbi:MAG: Ig-like domain-containing protein [Lachnospiraceae bacterium]|nr:Ig-like domain-containing protein [Lachnospiraceae bacterium]